MPEILSEPLKPKVSIGMPVFNGEPYLSAAINSLLNQTFTDFELIISDNASADKTQIICQEFLTKDKRVRYVRQSENVGAVRNFEIVLELAVADYFMWAAADDLTAPTFIEQLYAVLQHDSSFVLAMCDIVNISETGETTSQIDIDNIRVDDVKKKWRVYQERFFEVPTTNVFFCIYGLYVTAILRKVQLNYRKSVKYAAGSEIPFLAQVATFGKIGTVPLALKSYRRHSESVYNLEQQSNTKDSFVFWNNMNKLYVLMLVVFYSQLDFLIKCRLGWKIAQTVCRLIVDEVKNKIMSLVHAICRLQRKRIL
jgi:glycosyltransferase involved in cell wall biosynthesis